MSYQYVSYIFCGLNALDVVPSLDDFEREEYWDISDDYHDDGLVLIHHPYDVYSCNVGMIIRETDPYRVNLEIEEARRMFFSKFRVEPAVYAVTVWF